MRPIDQPAELKAYYQDGGVVGDYLRRRTAQPLNGMLHEGQSAFLCNVITERSPRVVLEVAPGPGRLTVELPQIPVGICAEFSPGMLEAARTRVDAAGRHWHFLRADAFSLPIAAASVDMAFSLRFVRHFGRDDRDRLYAELHRVLRPGGVLVLDAQNRLVRDAGHVARHPVFDELYTEAELAAEFASHGFRLLALHGIIRHHSLQRSLNRLRSFGLSGIARRLIDAVERVPSKNPSTWMALCERV